MGALKRPSVSRQFCIDLPLSYTSVCLVYDNGIVLYSLPFARDHVNR